MLPIACGLRPILIAAIAALLAAGAPAGAQTAATHVAPGVAAVISGLPLLSMPPELRESIVQAAFDVLAPNGTYVQFTYGPKPPLSPEQLDRMGLTVTHGPKVWANLPPARVFHFRRAA